MAHTSVNHACILNNTDVKNVNLVLSSNPNRTSVQSMNPGHDTWVKAITDLGLSVKRQGVWWWVFKVKAEDEPTLKALGFLYSLKRQGWYFVLKSEPFSVNPAIANALQLAQDLGLMSEHRGNWVWVFGAQSLHETPLRAAGFQWSYKRGCWYYNPQRVKPSVPPEPQNRGTAWDYYSSPQSVTLS